MPQQHTPSSFPGLRALAPGGLSALAVAACGGWLAAEVAPLLGAGLIVAALAWLLHAIHALHRRIVLVLAQSSEALHRLGRGDIGFQLNARGLPEFDTLLLAIDDLREGMAPISPDRFEPRAGGTRRPSMPLQPRTGLPTCAAEG